MAKLFHWLLLASGLAFVATAGASISPCEAGDQAKQEVVNTEHGGEITLAALEAQIKAGESRRVNGVKLELSAQVRDDKKGPVIDLHWKIINVSARSPLVISRPTINEPTGETVVYFWAAPKADKWAYSAYLGMTFRELLPDDIPLRPLPPIRTFRLDREWYTSIESGKQGTGVISVTAAEIKQVVQKSRPKQFSSEEPPRFFVEMWHRPKQRGEIFGLDAWTGRLHHPMIAIPPVSKW